MLKKVAERRKSTPAQMALAWLLAQKPCIVPIPGNNKPARLQENLAALKVDFSLDNLREIDRCSSKINLEGARYPERLEQMTGR